MKLCTAEEARKISDKKQTEKLEEARNRIIEMIQKAVNNGNYDVSFYYRIEPKIAEELEELGYQVDIVESASECGTIISWKRIEREEK